MICCVCKADTHGRGVRVTQDVNTFEPMRLEFCEPHYQEHEATLRPSAPYPLTPPEIVYKRYKMELEEVDGIVDAVLKAREESLARRRESAAAKKLIGGS